MMWVILGLVAAAIAVLAWARVQGLISADARVWRWLAGIAAAGVTIAALIGRRRAAPTQQAVEQVRDVLQTEAAIETNRVAVEEQAQAITHKAVEDAAEVRAKAAPSASLEEAADALTAAFGDP
jgi:hypothetical protein